MLNKKLNGFTLAELLVTLALTAILITLAYSGLNYIQRLLKQNNEHSFFITQITELEKRIDYQMNLSRQINQEQENELSFLSDSGLVTLVLNPEFILIKKKDQIDSFLLKSSGLQLGYEKLNNQNLQLINALDFDLDFSKQKFHCAFKKDYDGYSKFNMELNDGGN